MAQNIVSRSEFARMAGVSAMAVTKACRTKLMPACIGKRIDANNESAIKYITESVQQRPKASLNKSNKTILKNPRKKSSDKKKANNKKIIDEKKEAKSVTIGRSKEELILDLPDDIQEFLNWKLIDIVEKFGTMLRFRDFLTSTAQIEAINERRLKNAEKMGKLVSRDILQIVISAIDGALVKILTDGKRTIAGRGYAMIKAGKTEQELEEFIGDQLSSFIKPAKAKAERCLKSIE